MHFRRTYSRCFFAVQSVALHIDTNMMRSSKFCVDLEPILHQLLDLLEKLRCRGPWENIPLEHERFSGEVVQLSVFWS